MELQNNKVLTYEGCFGFHWVANAKESRLPACPEPTQHKYWQCYVALNMWLSKDVTLSHILHSDTASQIMPFSHERFFTPLWRTIKNSGQAGNGWEDRLKKITRSKRNKNLKMPSFCAVFNCSNHADREKGKSNYHFP